jgi:hypothetical protein
MALALGAGSLCEDKKVDASRRSESERVCRRNMGMAGCDWHEWAIGERRPALRGRWTHASADTARLGSSAKAIQNGARNG